MHCDKSNELLISSGGSGRGFGGYRAICRQPMVLEGVSVAPQYGIEAPDFQNFKSRERFH